MRNMIPYQSEAVVHCQHHNVYGSGVIGNTDTATFSTILPGGTETKGQSFAKLAIYNF